MSSFFLNELSKRFVRPASMPLLSFRMPYIGFGGFHQHLLSPNLSYYYILERQRDASTRRAPTWPFAANAWAFWTYGGQMPEALRNQSHESTTCTFFGYQVS